MHVHEPGGSSDTIGNSFSQFVVTRVSKLNHVGEAILKAAAQVELVCVYTHVHVQWPRVCSKSTGTRRVFCIRVYTHTIHMYTYTFCTLRVFCSGWLWIIGDYVDLHVHTLMRVHMNLHMYMRMNIARVSVLHGVASGPLRAGGFPKVCTLVVAALLWTPITGDC